MVTIQGSSQDVFVVSFDVFDTVLTRKVGEPQAAFLLVGRRAVAQGLIECSAHAFAKTRHAAEVRAFSNAGGLDSSVNLDDIYCEVANALHLSPDEASRLVALELAIESEILVPIPVGVDRVAYERSLGRQIIFVSDMYLPSSFIAYQLKRFGIREPDEHVFVSNELRRSKSTGSIWSPVLEAIGAEPSTVLHIGDNEKSDGRLARRAGLSVELVDERTLNRYERGLETHRDDTDGLSSAIAGASRLARLMPVESKYQAIADVAAGVVAPFAIGNLLWTLDVAKREGLKKLFFVARDGQVLCDVARELAPKVGYEGELIYTYGSRQAWTLASLTDNHTEAFDAMVANGQDLDVSLRSALRRFMIEPEHLSSTLEDNGFDVATWDAPLGCDGAERLRCILRDDAVAAEHVMRQAKLSRELVLGYLETVGAITSEPIGFVDLGTGATLFNALSVILESVGQAPPRGFYFGLRSHVPDSGFGRPLTYVRNEEERLGYLRTPGLLTLVELACTADHGSVVGYEDRDGTVHPIFASDQNADVVDWGLPVVHETVRNVARELLTDPELVGLSSIDLRPCILDVFSLFWTEPTKVEAEVWGAYPFEDGWGEESIRHPIAERRRFQDVLRATPHRHWWTEGSARLSGLATRKAFDVRRTAMETKERVHTKLVSSSRS